MAMFLDNQLVDKALGLTDGQKALRPWWDVIEDICMYGLILAGVVVFPTASLHSSPLACNACKEDICPEEYVNKENPPDIPSRWIVNYCTVFIMDRFILYFPYILLSIGFVLIGIERIFTSFFKADRKIDLFYTLIAKENLADTYEPGQVKLEESRDCLEVLYTFRERDNFFRSYMYRTFMEVLGAVVMFIVYFFYGQESLRKGNIMYCGVQGYNYECTGYHPQFYGIIFILALALLSGYIFCNSYNLIWLVLPHFGKMSRLMKGLRDYGSHNLQDIYYNNRDLALMLDLLAENSGVASSLRILGLFDKDFRRRIEASQVRIQRHVGPDGDVEMRVQFREAVHTRKLITLSKFIPSVFYTVEIKPHTKSFGIDAFIISDHDMESSNHKNVSDVEMNGSIGKKDDSLNFTSVIRDVDPGLSYAIIITTIINGKTVARVVETFEPLKNESIGPDGQRKNSIFSNEINEQ